MFSGYAALTIETMREHRVAAQRHQRELDAEEIRMLDATASSASSAQPAAPASVPATRRMAATPALHLAR